MRDRPGVNTQATILDVANHAGVSRTTVSRVLNHPHLVAPSTVQRVRKSVEELNFSANPTAQALRHGRVPIITLVTGDLSLPFTGEFATRFSQLAAEAGHMVSLVSHTGDDTALVESLRKQTPSITSAVVLGVHTNVDSEPVRAEIERMLDDGLGVVVSGDDLPGAPVHTVAITFPDAAADATTRLISHGYTRILLLNAPDAAQAGDFQSAYERVMENHGKASLVLAEDIKALDQGELLDVLTSRKVDAVITRSVRLAIAVSTMIADLGLRQRIPVVSCANSELLDFIRPPIDSYGVDITEYSSLLLAAVLNPDGELQTSHTRLIPVFQPRSNLFLGAESGEPQQPLAKYD